MVWKGGELLVPATKDKRDCGSQDRARLATKLDSRANDHATQWRLLHSRRGRIDSHIFTTVAKTTDIRTVPARIAACFFVAGLVCYRSVEMKYEQGIEPCRKIIMHPHRQCRVPGADRGCRWLPATRRVGEFKPESQRGNSPWPCDNVMTIHGCQGDSCRMPEVLSLPRPEQAARGSGRASATAKT